MDRPRRQFLALSSERRQAPDDGRHFGLVVDDKEAVRAALAAAGVDVAPSGGLRFHDPWGNQVEVVDYRDVQFTKAPAVLAALAPDGLEKTQAACAAVLLDLGGKQAPRAAPECGRSVGAGALTGERAATPQPRPPPAP